MICYLDMDGVLTDFHNPACAAHGIPMPDPWPAGMWSMTEATGITDEADFWRPLSNHEFWAELPWCEDGGDILRIAEETFGQSNICLLSSPTASPWSCSGKLEWIQKNLPRYRRQYALCPAKHFMANGNSVLIDDSDSNTRKFLQAGGWAVTVPRPWNHRHSDSNVSDTIRAQLARIAVSRS